MSYIIGESPKKRGVAVLAVIFVCAGVMHFVMPEYFIGIVPPALPRPDLLVAVSGVAEIAGGLGLLPTRTRRAAGVGLIALLVGVFPANLQMLHDWRAGGGGGWYEVALWLRLPLQAVVVWWVWRAAVARAAAVR